MLGLQLQPARDRLGLGRERSVEAKLAFVASLSNERVNQEQIRLAGRNEPAAVGRDVDTENRVAERGQGRLADECFR